MSFRPLKAVRYWMRGSSGGGGKEHRRSLLPDGRRTAAQPGPAPRSSTLRLQPCNMTVFPLVATLISSTVADRRPERPVRLLITAAGREEEQSWAKKREGNGRSHSPLCQPHANGAYGAAATGGSRGPCRGRSGRARCVWSLRHSSVSPVLPLLCTAWQVPHSISELPGPYRWSRTNVVGVRSAVSADRISVSTRLHGVVVEADRVMVAQGTCPCRSGTVGDDRPAAAGSARPAGRCCRTR